MRTPACNVRRKTYAQDALLNQRKLAMCGTPSPSAKAVRVETTRRGESHPRSLEVPSQFNREVSLQVLCRLAAREERQECLLRIIRPHSLRKHVVLKFHCLLQLFA